MREIRHVYWQQKKKDFKRYLRRVGTAYGLAALLAAVLGIFSEQKAEKKVD